MSDTIKHSEQSQAIIKEIYRACELLGGDFLLLSAIGSWGDTLPDADVLANLRGWNQERKHETFARSGQITSDAPLAYCPSCLCSSCLHCQPEKQ